MSDSGGIIQGVNNGRMRTDYEKNRLMFSDNQTDVMLAGVREDGTLGVDMSQPGVDVRTAADEELIFSSKFNLFKIVESGIVDLTMPQLSAGNSATVADSVLHSFGSIPIVVAFITFPSYQSPGSDYQRLFGTGVINAGSVGASTINVLYVSEEETFATATNINFSWKTTVGPGVPTQPEITARIKYFVLAETSPPEL